MRAAFYKGTRPEFLAGLYNKIVRKVDGSIYSHAELLFSNGRCASASFMDGGVRFRDAIDLDPAKWVAIELDPALYDEDYAYAWFLEHEGMPYDWPGNLKFVWHWWPSMPSRRFCTSALASALRVQPADKPYWYGPRKLAEALGLGRMSTAGVMVEADGVQTSALALTAGGENGRVPAPPSVQARNGS